MTAKAQTRTKKSAGSVLSAGGGQIEKQAESTSDDVVALQSDVQSRRDGYRLVRMHWLRQ
jgi:hypothetical protein